MYFRLTGAMKRRMILELQRYWAYHPKFQGIVGNIQGKYSFDERPQYGIIVKTSGGNKVDLSADNFVGTVQSYVMLTRVQNYPGLAIEWVGEDATAIQKNQGVFPSPPGIYYIELTKDDEFYVDPLFDVYHEQVMILDPSTAQLGSKFLKGTLRLYEMPSGFLLQEGVNYTADPATGSISLIKPLTGGRYLSADYRTPGATRGPFVLYENNGNNTAIPGCVLAFGSRNGVGDRLAVVVTPIRQPTALEYGGRWDITMDFDVVARDPDEQQEIADQTVIYMWGILRSRLSDEGIEMIDLSLGGESEEVYDENGDDYFYNSSFSATLQTEWHVRVPLDLFLRQAAPLTVQQAQAIAGLDDDQLAGHQGNIVGLESLGLQSVVDPFFRGRTRTFETIR